MEQVEELENEVKEIVIDEYGEAVDSASERS